MEIAKPKARRIDPASVASLISWEIVAAGKYFGSVVVVGKCVGSVEVVEKLPDGSVDGADTCLDEVVVGDAHIEFAGTAVAVVASLGDLRPCQGLEEWFLQSNASRHIPRWALRRCQRWQLYFQIDRKPGAGHSTQRDHDFSADFLASSSAAEASLEVVDVSFAVGEASPSAAEASFAVPGATFAAAEATSAVDEEFGSVEVGCAAGDSALASC